MVKYLGLNVTAVEMLDQDNELTITARSVSLGKIAKNMDNLYRIKYTQDYIPNHYYKRIDQSDYHEDRITIFDHVHNLAERTSHIDSTRNRKYHIEPGTRDFFSALYYLRTKDELNTGSFPLDANQVQWKAEYRLIGTDKIKSFEGEKECLLLEVSFRKEGNQEPERSDMLTNNLVDEEIRLYFWLTNNDRRLPVRAKFAMKPFPVIWKLTGYED